MANENGSRWQDTLRRLQRAGLVAIAILLLLLFMLLALRLFAYALALIVVGVLLGVAAVLYLNWSRTRRP
jgi:hypothetical protein